MPPSLVTRVRALDRDVTAFHEGIKRAGEAPSRDQIAGLYRAADQLATRSDAIRDVKTGWDQLDPAEHRAADRTLWSARNAARTIAQATHTGRHEYADTTVSTTQAASPRSARSWDRARDGQDLPNVRVVGSLAPPAVNLVADRLENVPERVVRTVDAQGIRSTLFSGGLTDVHGFKRLRGVQPRGWPDGSTWDIVPGVGMDTGMAANPNREKKGAGHGEESLSLHEFGHVVDQAVAKPHEDRVSESPRWRTGPQREARSREALAPYFKDYPSEWYAESFMRYTRSPQSHASLQRWYPDTYKFLHRELGAPRFS